MLNLEKQLTQLIDHMDQAVDDAYKRGYEKGKAESTEVDIVHCKDCRHYNKAYFPSGVCYGTFCDIFRYEYGYDHFCSRGERR